MWTGEQGAGACVEVQGLITGLPLRVSSCSTLATPSAPRQTHPTPPCIWKNPIQLIRFFKMDQFLISGASDYGQYHCRWEDSCWTAVFIYRNVCFLLYADGEAGNGHLRPLHHCSPWPAQAGVWPPHACLQQHHHHHLHQGRCRSNALWSCPLEDSSEYLFTSEQKGGLV